VLIEGGSDTAVQAQAARLFESLRALGVDQFDQATYRLEHQCTR
jgi:hypothetical protein